MAYCATVTIHDASGKGLHTIRYGRMPGGDVDGLVLGLKDDVMTLLGMRPTLQVTLLCDGAVEMWNLLGEALTEAALGRAIARLVDLWHFLEKMGKAARRRFEAPQATAWLTRWRLRLLNKSGAWRELQAEVTAWGLEEPREQKDRPVHDALTFLANQGGAGRLEYAIARAAGRPVGSGPVEATCKSLFNVRFKRSGARWKDASGEEIVRLRALHLSHRWVAALELTLEAKRRDVRRVA
jgi:hypothetical protein